MNQKSGDRWALEERIRDLKRQAAALEGLMHGDGLEAYSVDTQDASTDINYKRETHRHVWRIGCLMCKESDKIATRYPGGKPTICDDCMSNYKNPASARAALSRMRKKEREAGLS